MADATGLAEKIKRAALEAQGASRPVRLCFGEVISEEPLKINVEQKMILGEAQLLLSRNVTDYVISAEVDWETGEQGGGAGETACERHSHRISGQKQIMIHNALKPGDEVILIRQQEGQKFLVLDRMGGKP
ncbi:MAG: DUF2577 domain-containing protein [Hungatella sp.]|nr:DUF2577 domain-containing protein [Hungatella sp.]